MAWLITIRLVLVLFGRSLFLEVVIILCLYSIEIIGTQLDFTFCLSFVTLGSEYFHDFVLLELSHSRLRFTLLRFRKQTL